MLPTGKELLYRFTPTDREKANYRHLAEEYAVFLDKEMSHGIAVYERQGEAWIGACSLRAVLAHALTDLCKARAMLEEQKAK